MLPAGGPFAITVDSQIAGVHFPPDLDPSDLARRLLAVNLSDLAAMGARPAYAFLALSAPPGFDHCRFFRAFLAACQRNALELAGGDLAASRQTVATLTLLGSKPDTARWLRRSGAAPGHGLWLGGTVGESAVGRLLIERGARWQSNKTELPMTFKGPQSLLTAARRAVRRHLLPQPQLDLGAWLGRQRDGAAIDVSDGVARDLHRLCRESGVGAELIAENLPLSARFHSLCSALGADPLTAALGGGEDYVLLFSLPAGSEPPIASGCRCIGRITKGRRVAVRQGGVSRLLQAIGWDHLEMKKAPAR